MDRLMDTPIENCMQFFYRLSHPTEPVSVDNENGNAIFSAVDNFCFGKINLFEPSGLVEEDVD